MNYCWVNSRMTSEMGKADFGTLMETSIQVIGLMIRWQVKVSLHIPIEIDMR